DLLVSEPGAYIGFAGPKVIEQTIRQTLPDGFQTAGFLLDHGQLDLVEARETMRVTLRKILDLHAGANGSTDGLPETDGQPLITHPEQIALRDPWEIVQLARHIDRPNALEYIGHIFDDFLELQGDRMFAQDAAIVGGLAKLGGRTVMVVGHQKGHTTQEMME